jgi:hypothetical protein
MGTNATFEIGLVMAGAVSAGAYSAGVVDFLIEALDAYEQEKHKPEWDGPTHDVKVPILTGASAGGMTAALAALHFYRDIEHAWPGKPAPEGGSNRLYSTWVSDISLERLLETRDLDGPGVRSLLGSAILDDILRSAFDLRGEVRQRPWVGGAADSALTLIFTLTNLRGVPYSFELFGNLQGERYGMLNHRDDIEFTLGVGPSRLNSGGRWLDAAQLDDPGWELFGRTALATGAFPAALAPRLLDRPARDYIEQGHVGVERELGRFEALHPDESIKRLERYDFIGVDGGVMDNEPLELARRHLAGGPGRSNPRSGDEAHRAVLLVDPFPNCQDLPEANRDDTLATVMFRLFGALKNQARFKPEELELAASDRVFSRFMIAPSRDPWPLGGGGVAAAHPIASSALGAFGGFLHESFRRHDYLLGRRNAQDFLRWNFVLPETNPLFRAFNDPQARERWYVRDAQGRRESVAACEEPGLKVKRVPAKAYEGGAVDEKALPIIPLVRRLKEPIVIYACDEPKPYSIDMENLRKLLRKRADALYMALIQNTNFEVRGSRLSFVRKLLGRSIARAAWRTLGRDYLVETVLDRIEDAQRDVARWFDCPVKD